MAFQLISAREAESLMDHWEYVVIDLRNDRDYRKGHMQGALNLPYEFSGSLYRKNFPKAGDISFIAAMAEQYARRQEDVRTGVGCFKYKWWNFIIQGSLICIKSQK